ncbi:unnamed protein product [Owenia fusiformis]|uniref:Uncharacterized protein n=1 Tax=Owenia fusiformis TaxID=6347 RepID=A0A8J1Y171_OWEFU|nr:unnamed protein product [Owenia fusiformis]
MYTMEKEHKTLLQRKRVELLDINVGPKFMGYLFAVEILSRDMKEELEAIPEPTRRASRFLDLIVRRGPKAFNELYEALIRTSQGDLADILKPDQAEKRQKDEDRRIEAMKASMPASPSHGSSPLRRSGDSFRGQPIDTASEDEPLPEEWPLPKDSWSALAEINSMKEMRIQSQAWEDRYNGKNPDYYPMNSSPKGRMIIINNKNFDKSKVKLSYREGTDNDATCLSQLFRKLGYSVQDSKSWKDLTAKEIKEKLQKESQLESHNRHTSFICAILSHGAKGNRIYGVDGDTIAMKDIKEIFQNCPALTGKPKIFIVQACQGSAKDTGVLDTSFNSSMSYDTDQGRQSPVQFSNRIKPAPCESTDPSLKSPTESGDDSMDASYGEFGDSIDSVPTSMPTAQSCDSLKSLPGNSDILVANATTDDMASWRIPDVGTWFIQAIIYVFARYAHNTEIGHLFRKVNHLVSKATTKKLPLQYKQQSCIDETLRLQLYFYPGMGSENVL